MKKALVFLLALAAAVSFPEPVPLKELPVTNTVYTSQQVDAALAAASNALAGALAQVGPDATNHADAAAADVRAYAVAVSNTLDAAIGAIEFPEPDWSETNDALVTTIHAVAPPPGDYATVSNKAMTAIQTEADPAFALWAGTNTVSTSLSSLSSRLSSAGHAATNYTDEAIAAIQFPDTSLSPATNYTDEAIAAAFGTITVRTKCGYRDPKFWLPKVTAGAGTSRTIAISKAGQALGIDGDITWRRAYNDGSEAYVLAAYIEPDRRVGESDIENVSGTWSIVSDSSGACTIQGNSLKGGGKDAVVVLRFTADDGTSKTLTVRVGAYSRNETVMNVPYEEYDGTFRHAYATNILARFAALDWNTGHYFPNFVRVNRDRWLPCYFGREPWELELFSDYDSWCGTETKIWNNSTNMTWFTGGVHDSPLTKSHGLTYKTTLISMANGPKEMNEDFFWPELQDKLRAVSGARADWYAEKTAIKLSKHYILCATHYNQNSHRFFRESGAYTNVTSTVAFDKDADDRLLGSDWTVKVVPGGIPDDVPDMEFFGAHGTNALSSLFALSPSLLRGAPGIQLTQGNTVALAYVSTATGGSFYRTDGLPAVTNSIYYSHILAFEKNTLHWVCTNYPAMNAEHPFYNKKVIRWKNESAVNANGHVFTLDDIDGFYDATAADSAIFYKGEHYPIQGDSSRPLMGFYNGHLWLYGLYFSPSGGQSALDLFVTSRLDAFIRADSLDRFGAEEGLTFCDCCDLDPNHQFHVHP